jgi:hypothetical protein
MQVNRLDERLIEIHRGLERFLDAAQELGGQSASLPG